MTVYNIPQDFDLDAYLARPLIARVATNGPTIRPVWYLWEDHAFWWLTGSWATLKRRVERDPAVALVVDSWEPTSGEVWQVIATGRAEIRPFDAERSRRKLARYLGSDRSRWDRLRFIEGTFDDPSAALVRLRPNQLSVKDLSYHPPA